MSKIPLVPIKGLDVVQSPLCFVVKTTKLHFKLNIILQNQGNATVALQH